MRTQTEPHAAVFAGLSRKAATPKRLTGRRRKVAAREL
jgi:hypothetical protein